MGWASSAWHGRSRPNLNTLRQDKDVHLRNKGETGQVNSIKRNIVAPASRPNNEKANNEKRRARKRAKGIKRKRTTQLQPLLPQEPPSFKAHISAKRSHNFRPPHPHLTFPPESNGHTPKQTRTTQNGRVQPHPDYQRAQRDPVPISGPEVSFVCTDDHGIFEQLRHECFPEQCFRTGGRDLTCLPCYRV
jgi:hypothetical protein